MSRNGRNVTRVGSRDLNIAWEAAKASLEEIESLVAVYDSGRWLTYRTLSVVIARMLFEELRLVAAHEDFEFVSTSIGVDENNLLDCHPLTGMKITNGHPNTVEFFATNREHPLSSTKLSLTKWLDEIIYLEGASSYQQRLTQGQLKFRKSRYKITRRQAIRRTRDEVGAHFDEAVSDVWAMLHSQLTGLSFGGIDEMGGLTDSNSRPDLFVFVNTIADASIRAIAGEVILSLRQHE